jgi:NADH-quinone oxidoreductase subunit F
MASVQEHIIGNCLCVLGDAMAMPIGSMIAKFREEFEEHIERARAARGLNGGAASELALAAQGVGQAPTHLARQGTGDQVPGAHEGSPGTQRGGA